MKLAPGEEITIAFPLSIGIRVGVLYRMIFSKTRLGCTGSWRLLFGLELDLDPPKLP